MPEKKRLQKLKNTSYVRKVRQTKQIAKQKCDRQAQLNLSRNLVNEIEFSVKFETFQQSIRKQECLICKQKFFDIKVNLNGVCTHCIFLIQNE